MFEISVSEEFVMMMSGMSEAGDGQGSKDVLDIRMMSDAKLLIIDAYGHLGHPEHDYTES
jgi:hypothetical protein